MVSGRTARVLARCNGFRVKAGEEVVGSVATPVFSGQRLLPEYLLIRLDDAAMPGAFRAVPPELVASADANSATLTLEIDRAELASLPEPDVLHRISPPAAKPLPSQSPPTARHDAPALRDERMLLRHRMATPLTVIRGSAVTLRDVATLSDGEIMQLVSAIERATRDLERAVVDALVLDSDVSDIRAALGNVATDARPVHEEIGMRLARHAAAIAASSSVMREDVELLAVDLDELRGLAG